MGIGSDKKGQDKKRICERDCENCKAGRQTLECQATYVWTRKKERRRLRVQKDDGDGGASLRLKDSPSLLHTLPSKKILQQYWNLVEWDPLFWLPVELILGP